MKPARHVKRVLVMLDYGPEDPDSGEVFDLTAIISELLPGAGYSDVSVKMELQTAKDYSKPSPWPINTRVEWKVMAGGDTWFVPATGHLTDAINAGLPDGPEVTSLKKRIKKVQTKLEEMHREAGRMKLDQVAQLRALHPVAKVTETPLLQIGGAA